MTKVKVNNRQTNKQKTNRQTGQNNMPRSFDPGRKKCVNGTTF